MVEFTVTFLGSKSHNTSSTILNHPPNKILIDFGDDYSNIPEDITEIVITHAHPDHAFGLRGKQLGVPVYMNKFSNGVMTREDFPFRRKIFWRKPFFIGDVRVTPVPIVHSMKAPTSGLIFETAGKRIAYFPDVLEVKNKEVLKGIDLYIGDGTVLERNLERKLEGKRIGHASIRTQLGWLRDAGVKHALFTHFGKWALQEDIQPLFDALSEEFSVRVREAFRDYRVLLGRKVRLQRALRGIYVPPPHAANIVEGYQTIIVTPEPAPFSFLLSPVFFLQDSMVYGRLRLTSKHGPVSLDEIQKMSDKHQMAPKEFDKFFPGVKEFYYYDFKLEEAFIPPRKAKDIKVWKAQESAEKIQDDAEKPSEYAPVSHYGNELGREVKLKEVLDRWSQPIVLKKGYITLTGGLTNWGGTKGDIDFIVAEAEEIVARDQPVLFRLGRALPADLAERLSRKFAGEYGGPFTSFVPVYDLVLVPSTEKRLVRLSRIEQLRDPEGRKQAEASLREDKVEPGRFVAPLKGYRAYYKFAELAAKAIAEDIPLSEFPLYAQKKYDGAITEWLRNGDVVTVRTDAGFDVTGRFPTLIDVAKRILPNPSTILCETEMWTKGEHLPREVVSGWLNSKGNADDSQIVLNAFDIMYNEEDVHRMGYGVRYDRMKKIHWGQSTDAVPHAGFNLTPSVMVYTPREILSALNTTAGYPASEGTVIKTDKMTYELDGLTRKMMKWKKLAEIHGVITAKKETKTPNVFTYYIGVVIPSGWKAPEGVLQTVGDTKYMFIAKTFNVAADYKVGTVVSFTFHTMNWYRKSDGTQYITAYEPKLIDVSSHERPDTASEAIEIARSKELLTVKRLQNFPMDDGPHKATMQMHYRGRSAHMDFRIQTNGQLGGMTLLIEKPNAILDDVTTVEQAKAIERRWDHYFKLSNEEQTQKIQVTWKASEPIAWLDVEKVVPKGEVGATKDEFGVFSIVDRPTVYFGVQKPYFKEFFIEGKLLSGRWVVRLLRNPWAPKPPFVFIMWKPNDQTPYVLTNRAVKKKWIPPPNVSALPPSIRASIPANFKYWVENNISERLAIREALVSSIAKGEVKLKDVRVQQTGDVAAVLQHRWWRGQLVVRGGPTEELWDLRLRSQPLVHFVLRENIQVVDETTATLEKPEWKEVHGVEEIKPGSEENPTVATPAFVETIDSGSAKIWETKEGFLKVTFNMKELKGMWIFVQPEPGQNLWVATREKESP